MKQSKHICSLILLLIWALGAHATAYDFAAQMPSGQTLYFAYDGAGVRVVYPAETAVPLHGWSGFAKPSGALIIPATVQHNGNTYPVVAIGTLAFSLCADLTSVELGEGIRSLRMDAFYGCSSLATITLPSTIDSIGHSAFYNCTALRYLTLLRQQPPIVHSAAFTNVPVGGLTLQVPCGCEPAYANDAPWNTFDTIIALHCNHTITASANYASRGQITGGGTYARGNTAVLTATPARHCFFACWNDGDTLNPRTIIANQDIDLTAFFFLERYDTVVVHDTLHLLDTLIAPTFRIQTVSATPTRGVAVGRAEVVAGSEVEIGALPLEGNRFVGWSDGVNSNPRRLHVVSDTTLVALFEADNANLLPSQAPQWSAHAVREGIEVTAPCGTPVLIYDSTGRLITHHTASGTTQLLTVPAAGLYVVTAGDGVGRKLTVGL